MVNKYKAEAIERECIQRMLDEAYEDLKKTNPNTKVGIPECVWDTILRMTARELVSCKACQLSRWN